MRRAQIIVALVMAVPVAVALTEERGNPDALRWALLLAAPVAALLGWVLDRTLCSWVAAMPAPDDDYAPRAVAALAIAGIVAPVVLLTGAPPAVAGVAVAAYWLVAEPLLGTDLAVAVRVRQSGWGRRAARVTRAPAVQGLLLAVVAALGTIGGLNTLLRELGVGGVPYVGIVLGSCAGLAYGFGEQDDTPSDLAPTADALPGTSPDERVT